MRSGFLDWPNGTTVVHRVTRERGTVTNVMTFGHVVIYEVAFGSGAREVPSSDLQPADENPFALLSSPPAEIYPHDGWLRREAIRLIDAYRNDPAAALSNSRVDPQHHQISVVLRVLEKSQPRMILADEVGLGKTIEAGLILKELRARGTLERVLILAPASLVSQWQYELRTKFNELFVQHDGAFINSLERARPEDNPWGVESNVICSYQLARGDADRIAAAEWDLVIMDEAHHANRSSDEGQPRANLAYDLLERLRDRVSGVLLLTATPMQLNDYQLYSLVELVEPGLFASYRDFVDSRNEIALINEHVAWLRTGPGNQHQRDLLAGLMRRWDFVADIT